MQNEEQRLDGNAMAGTLGEIFPFDMTTVTIFCAGCGATEKAGVHPVYANAPGMVMCCLHCENILIRVAHGGGRFWLDMRGVACLEIIEPR